MKQITLALLLLNGLTFKTIAASGGDHLSTLFVLDTSDADSQQIVHEGNESPGSLKNSKQSTDAHTLIVTDSVHELDPSINNQGSLANRTKQTNKQKHQSTSGTEHQLNERSDSINQANGRRLEEISVMVPKLSGATLNKNQQQLRSRLSTTTASSHLDEDDEILNKKNSNAPPKTDKRLLISITDDKPPPKIQGLNEQGYDSDDSPQVNSNKRKPQITIEIDPSDTNKYNVGGGSPSVILRPGDDGHSIVIATVNNGGAIVGSNGHKQNQRPPANKPSMSNQPIREPANIPVQHQFTQSTTRRPPTFNNEQNTNHNDDRPTSNERPVRPSRPIVGNQDDLINSQGTSSSHVQRPPSSSDEDTSDDGIYSGHTQSSNGDLGSHGQSSFSHNGIRYPLNENDCGLPSGTKIVGGDDARPNDFMWMAAIIKSEPKEGEVRPFCGGSLITRRHILTAAHCLENLTPRDVLVRLGGYDFDDSTASPLSQDFAIDQFRVPNQYSRKNHTADIAIMRLKTPLEATDTYKTICMPLPRRSYVGALGKVTGYGSQSQTFRRASPKLRQVTVPIWENRKCSVVYRRNMTDSFLCAGYEEGGRDACQGDSGGPLMIEGQGSGGIAKMMIVGVVSHGIGCGTPGYPGVYTRTTTFLDWIEKNTKE